MVSQTGTEEIGKPGQEWGKVGKSMEGKTRREKEEGKGTDLFMAIGRGPLLALGEGLGGTPGTQVLLVSQSCIWLLCRPVGP
jgi:hypothetical protein